MVLTVGLQVKRAQSPEGAKERLRLDRTRSFVPHGTRFIFAAHPSDESLGYSRASLRDEDWVGQTPVSVCNPRPSSAARSRTFPPRRVLTSIPSPLRNNSSGSFQIESKT